MSDVSKIIRTKSVVFPEIFLSETERGRIDCRFVDMQTEALKQNDYIRAMIDVVESEIEKTTSKKELAAWADLLILCCLPGDKENYDKQVEMIREKVCDN